MTNKQAQQQYAIGMVGLGVTGRNLALKMGDYGFSVAGYDKDPNQVEALRKESTDWDICGAEIINDFIALLRPPLAVMMLVPAGAPVDSRRPPRRPPARRLLPDRPPTPGPWPVPPRPLADE